MVHASSSGAPKESKLRLDQLSACSVWGPWLGYFRGAYEEGLHHLNFSRKHAHRVGAHEGGHARCCLNQFGKPTKRNLEQQRWPAFLFHGMALEASVGETHEYPEAVQYAVVETITYQSREERDASVSVVSLRGHAAA